MAKSKIEWTEQTWNPITGCTKVSAGCKNCYAESIANRFWGERKFTDIVFHEDRLTQPLRWKKPRMVFVNSMSDFFHEKISYEIIIKLLAIMEYNSHHIFQILTKRPKSAIRFFDWYKRKIQKNIWFGVSVENKKYLDRIELLQKFPCKIRFISFEPLLEDIGNVNLGGIDWVIVGGESGHNKRPFNPDWARNILKQCKEQNVVFFMKQVDKVRPIPEDLFVREFPL